MSEPEIFWIGIGDIHDNTTGLNRIPNLTDAQAVLVSGDLTLRGNAADGRAIMDAVRAFNPMVLAQIGNMDGPDINDYLQQKDVNLHAQGRELTPGVGVMGVGTSTPTPFGTPSEYPDSQIEIWLAEAYEQVKDYPALLLVAHDPPNGSATDVIPGGGHVGSKAVREFIERVQPDVCLTGHIHEARAQDTIGKTIVINTGTLMEGGYAFIWQEKDGRLNAELRQA